MTAKDTVDALYRAFAAGDVPTVLGFLDDKVEWTEARRPYETR
jgi:ketosteroid isomerase-like protein